MHFFYQTTIQQWRFGATGVKPTTLLCANIDLTFHVEQCSLADIVMPVNPLIGMKPSGEFRTSEAKEYPPGLNKAFASAVMARAICLPPCGPAEEAPHAAR